MMGLNKRLNGVVLMIDDPQSSYEKLQDYKLHYLEKQVIDNQNEMLDMLTRFEDEFKKKSEKRNTEHEQTQLKLKEHDLEIQIIKNRFTKMDSSLRVIITTVIAQLLILITQVLLPHFFH